MWVPEVGCGGDSGGESGDSGGESGGGCGGSGGGNKSCLLADGCFVAASDIAELRKSCSRSQ